MRAVILALLIALLLMQCAGCSGGAADEALQGEQTEATSDTLAETERIYPDIPNFDFEGYDFTVLHFEIPFIDGIKDIVSEGENGETLNDAVFRRNISLSEKCDVNIKLKAMQYSDINREVMNTVSAGDDVYGAVYCRLYEVPPLISGGYLLDLNKLGYVDFSNPWWDQNSVRDLSINHKLYLVATDLNITDKDATYCMLYNKTIAGKYNIPDMYALVEQGKWTIDELLRYSEDVTTDLDGNGKIDKNDLYGILGRYDATASLFRGANCLLAGKDENDIPYLTFESEYNYSVIEKIFDVMYSDDFFNLHINNVTEADFFKMIANEQGLFVFDHIYKISDLRAYDIQFGILPIPKYSETQESYKNLVSVHSTGLLSVPVSTADTERTGVILEWLSALSRQILQPAYYDVNLIGKGLRDNESEKMLDIIFQNRIYDIGDIYNFADFSYKFLCISSTKQRDIASFYEKSENAVQKALDNMVEDIMKLE